ncbi:MAG: hypothetical protein ACPGZP_10970 [Panacagrimonas sp.]
MRYHPFGKSATVNAFLAITLLACGHSWAQGSPTTATPPQSSPAEQTTQPAPAAPAAAASAALANAGPVDPTSEPRPVAPVSAPPPASDDIEPPLNASYTIPTAVTANSANFRNGGEVKNQPAATASYLGGVTVSVHADDTVAHCSYILLYPKNPTVRAFHQNSRYITTLYLQPPVDTVHIPLPGLFVGKGVSLGQIFNAKALNAGTDGQCTFYATLHMRPVQGRPLP